MPTKNGSEAKCQQKMQPSGGDLGASILMIVCRHVVIVRTASSERVNENELVFS